jgi:hypothetical protein
MGQPLASSRSRLHTRGAWGLSEHMLDKGRMIPHSLSLTHPFTRELNDSMTVPFLYFISKIDRKLKDLCNRVP